MVSETSKSSTSREFGCPFRPSICIREDWMIGSEQTSQALTARDLNRAKREAAQPERAGGERARGEPVDPRFERERERESGQSKFQRQAVAAF